MTDTPPTRVLYVEDDTQLQYTIAQLMNLMGYEMATANNGREGVTKAVEWQPEFILMDIRMPVMDGIDAVKALRSDPATEHIPIFMLSAFTDAKTRKACTDAGADGFFVKPPDISRIDATIKRVLNKD